MSQDRDTWASRNKKPKSKRQAAALLLRVKLGDTYFADGGCDMCMSCVHYTGISKYDRGLERWPYGYCTKKDWSCGDAADNDKSGLSCPHHELGVPKGEWR